MVFLGAKSFRGGMALAYLTLHLSTRYTKILLGDKLISRDLNIGRACLRKMLWIVPIS